MLSSFTDSDQENAEDAGSGSHAGEATDPRGACPAGALQRGKISSRAAHDTSRGSGGGLLDPSIAPVTLQMFVLGARTID